MIEIEQSLAEHGAAHHRIVRPRETDAGDFHYLLSKRTLLLVSCSMVSWGKRGSFPRAGGAVRLAASPPTIAASASNGSQKWRNFMVLPPRLSILRRKLVQEHRGR